MKQLLGKFIVVLLFGTLSVSCSEGQSMIQNMDAKELRSKYIESNDSKYVEELLNRLNSTQEDIVLESLHSLRLLGGNYSDLIGEKVIRRIEPLLKNDDPGFQHSVLATVLAFGEHAYPLLPQLSEVVRKNETGAALFAARTIGMIGERANRAQDVLIDVLGSKTETRIDAANSLASIGALTRANVSKIESFFFEETLDPYFEIALAKALLVNGVRNEKIIDSITKVALYGFEDLRYSALKVLKESMTTEEPWARELLIKIGREDESENIRKYAESLMRPKNGSGLEP